MQVCDIQDCRFCVILHQILYIVPRCTVLYLIKLSNTLSDVLAIKKLYCGRMKYVSSPSVQLIIKVKKNMHNMAHVKFSHCRMLVFQVFKLVYVSRFQCYSFEQNLTVFNTCLCIKVCYQHVLLVGNITYQMHGLQCGCTSYRCDTSTCEAVKMQLLLTATVVGR